VTFLQCLSARDTIVLMFIVVLFIFLAFAAGIVWERLKSSNSGRNTDNY
jgi:hypothetical protein